MRVGVLGCGLVAQAMHIPYLAELPGPELHAFVDPARGRAETLADRYEVPHTFGDHQALLETVSDDLDAVVVLTPSHAHADPTVDALEEGLAVLVEKPIATTPEDARRMIEAATDAAQSLDNSDETLRERYSRTGAGELGDLATGVLDEIDGLRGVL